VLGSLADAFREVRTQHPEEWAIYRLADVALAHSLQPLAELFAGWSPLEAPAHGVKQLLAWRPLLESTSGAHAFLRVVCTLSAQKGTADKRSCFLLQCTKQSLEMSRLQMTPSRACSRRRRCRRCAAPS
jgi:hypothetical protein